METLDKKLGDTRRSIQKIEASARRRFAEDRDEGIKIWRTAEPLRDNLQMLEIARYRPRRVGTNWSLALR